MTRAQIGKKISQTKRSPEGIIRMKAGRAKRKDIPFAFRKGQKPWNYIPENEKPRVICLGCNTEIIVRPSEVESTKFCNRQCERAFKKGKPHLNWNPASMHDKGGKGISGRYK